MQSKAIEKSNQHAKLCKQLISRSIWAHFQWPLRLNSKFILMSVMSVMSVMSEYQKDWWDTPNRPKRFFFFCWLFHPNHHHHQHCKASDITSAASGMSFPRQAFCRKWGTTCWHGDLSATKCNESPINQQLGPTNHPLAQDCSSF